MLDSQSYGQAQSIFEEIIAKPLNERASSLLQACGNEPSLMERVQTMIELYEEERTPFSFGADFAVGQQIGIYQITKLLGKGGMGAVYLAERTDEFPKQVAIKVLAWGFGEHWAIRRFRTEGQILAFLEHPNIIRFVDSGVSATGVPYLVMDYVEGIAIDTFCELHHLDLRKRLALFLRVCDAVQAAHKQQVVHRDLKPSNILITSDGQPKLLDFGLAKLLLPPTIDLPSHEQTQTLVRVMTPSYASPEQLRGEEVSAASDIYSLGVLLYELLSGQRPYNLTGLSPQAVEKLICTEIPAPPSAKSKRTHATESLHWRLRGDLDAVVLMAIRKEAHLRYASVKEFADDIRRYLAGQTVLARRDTYAFTYQASKFLQRRTWFELASGAFSLTTMAGFFWLFTHNAAPRPMVALLHAPSPALFQQHVAQSSLENHRLAINASSQNTLTSNSPSKQHRRPLPSRTSLRTFVAGQSNPQTQPMRISSVTIGTGITEHLQLREPRNTFSIDAPNIYCVWQVLGGKGERNLKVAWIAEDTGGLLPNNYEMAVDAVKVNHLTSGSFYLSKPGDGWEPGQYHLDLYLDQQLIKTVPFSVTPRLSQM